MGSILSFLLAVPLICKFEQHRLGFRNRRSRPFALSCLELSYPTLVQDIFPAKRPIQNGGSVTFDMQLDSHGVATLSSRIFLSCDG